MLHYSCHLSSSWQVERHLSLVRSVRQHMSSLGISSSYPIPNPPLIPSHPLSLSLPSPYSHTSLKGTSFSPSFLYMPYTSLPPHRSIFPSKTKSDYSKFRAADRISNSESENVWISLVAQLYCYFYTTICIAREARYNTVA